MIDGVDEAALAAARTVAIAWTSTRDLPAPPPGDALVSVVVEEANARATHTGLRAALDRAWNVAAQSRPGTRRGPSERPGVVAALAGRPALVLDLSRQLAEHPHVLVERSPTPCDAQVGETRLTPPARDAAGWSDWANAISRAGGTQRSVVVRVDDEHTAWAAGAVLSPDRFPQLTVCDVQGTLSLDVDTAEARTRLADARAFAASGHADEALAVLGDTADEALLAADLWGPGDARASVALRRAAHERPVVAARALLKLGDLLTAWEVSRAAVLDAPDAQRWLVHYEVAVRLERDREATEALECAVASAPDDVALRARAARHRLACRDATGATPHVRAALRAAPHRADLLALDAELAVLEDAPDAEARIMAAHRARPEAWRTAWSHLVAAHLPAAAAAITPPEARGVQARLALWRGDTAEAARLALRASPDDAVAAMVRGAVSALGAEPTSALPHLQAALRGVSSLPDLDRDAVLCWRSEAERRAGDGRAALGTARAAMAAATRYTLHGDLCRLRAVLALHAPTDVIDPGAHQGVTHKLAARTGTPRPAERPPAEVLTTFLDTHTADLGLDRTASPTVRTDAGLRGWRVPDHPRHLGRVLHHDLRVRDPESVLEAYRALQDRFPADPTVWTYAGETRLWLGRYDEAAADLSHAIALDPETVWAWIGLGASQLLRGDADAAIATFQAGVEAVNHHGPTLFVYRGEARWTRGELGSARRNLDLALAGKPQRWSAWAVRALLAADEGDAVPAGVVAEQLRAVMPSLWSDARARCDRDDPVDLLRAAHALTLGNRSSSMVTWLHDGVVRFGRWRPPGPAQATFPSIRTAKPAPKPGVRAGDPRHRQ